MTRTFYIAGVQFRPRDEINRTAKEMKVGDKIGLKAEPDNKYDPNAVQILFDNSANEYDPVIFLGYVPKKLSAEVSAMLEIGPVECVVDEVNPSAKIWEMFKVSVRTIEEELENDTYEGDIL
jgi:hypothetical protein